MSLRAALPITSFYESVWRMKKALWLTLFCLFGAVTTPAHAGSGWRYWGYFQANPGVTQWSYAMTGPTTIVADGSVEGWAFTFSGDDIADAAAPKISPEFSRICGTTKAVSQKKRVGLVVDFGPAALRPQGERLPRAIVKCLVLDKDATGVEVLNTALKVRYAASGYVCGINSYPLKECGLQIKTPRTLVKK